MNTAEILAAIDAQIAQLQQARGLIAGAVAVEPSGRRRGRPKGSTNKPVAAPVKVMKRVMSADGKARIAAAQKLRWAAQKRAATPLKLTAKKSAPKSAKKAAAKPESTKQALPAE